LPSPISSAISARPPRCRANTTPSRWCAKRAEYNCAGSRSRIHASHCAASGSSLTDSAARAISHGKLTRAPAAAAEEEEAEVEEEAAEEEAARRLASRAGYAW